ncbi:hypothetical protein BDM02DRAFT_3113277 [Thelephora ganbajun]|uniref:Uncharacterized protein n=1 Tax=Thelephora ganbajun TaxID=370292 RepID=A0ACB6ZK77_THEGA|nr:hypothetical protein BDM02DRAFT_3113277 [Thelephora ganbajun]
MAGKDQSLTPDGRVDANSRARKSMWRMTDSDFDVATVTCQCALHIVTHAAFRSSVNTQASPVHHWPRLFYRVIGSVESRLLVPFDG